MKKSFLTLCMMIASATGLQVHAQTKLGHIDRQGLMLLLPERKPAEDKMKAFAADLKKKLDAMKAELDAKQAEAEAKVATMTNTEKDMASRDLQDMAGRIQDAQTKAQEDLNKQEEELLAPMVTKTNQAIKDVANENHFTYIFDSSTGMVLFYDNGEDIMPLVKKKLNIL